MGIAALVGVEQTKAGHAKLSGQAGQFAVSVDRVFTCHEVDMILPDDSHVSSRGSRTTAKRSKTDLALRIQTRFLVAIVAALDTQRGDLMTTGQKKRLVK